MITLPTKLGSDHCFSNTSFRPLDPPQYLHFSPMKQLEKLRSDPSRKRYNNHFLFAMEQECAVEYKTYMCVICGFIYEEEKGLPEEGLAPGTRWEDIPDTWVCPDCDAPKEDFEMVEI